MFRRLSSFAAIGVLILAASLGYLSIERTASSSTGTSIFSKDAFARRAELRRLARRHREEQKALKAQNRSELKAWTLKERDARRQFFSQNPEGSKKREYIQDYIRRREALDSELNQKLNALREKQNRERQELVQKQVEALPQVASPSPPATAASPNSAASH